MTDDSLFRELIVVRAKGKEWRDRARKAEAQRDALVAALETCFDEADHILGTEAEVDPFEVARVNALSICEVARAAIADSKRGHCASERCLAESEAWFPHLDAFDRRHYALRVALNEGEVILELWVADAQGRAIGEGPVQERVLDVGELAEEMAELHCEEETMIADNLPRRVDGAVMDDDGNTLQCYYCDEPSPATRFEESGAVTEAVCDNHRMEEEE